MSGPVLILDATPEGESIAAEARGAGYLVLRARPEDGEALAALRRPALVVLDVDAPSALALCGLLRSRPGSAGLPIVLVGHPGMTVSSAADAIVRGGNAFVTRPVDRQKLLDTLRTFMGGSAEPVARDDVANTDAAGPTITSVAPREKTFVLSDGPAPSASPEDAERKAVAVPAGPPSPADYAGGAPSDLPLSTELRRVLSDVEQRLFPESPPLMFQSLPSEEDLEAFFPADLADEVGQGLGDDEDPSVDTFAGAFETESFLAEPSAASSEPPAGAVSAPASRPSASVPAGALPRDVQIVDSDSQPNERIAPLVRSRDSQPPRESEAPKAAAVDASLTELATGVMPTVGRAEVVARPSSPSSAPEEAPARGSNPSTPPQKEPERPTSPSPPPVHEPAQAANTAPQLAPGRRTRAAPDSRRLQLHGASISNGEVQDVDLPQLLAAAWAGRFTGQLRFVRAEAEKVVHLSDGQVLTVVSNVVEDRLVEVLWREGRIPRAHYEQVRAMIADSGRRAGAILVERGVLRHEELFPLVRHHFEGLLYDLFAWDRGQWSAQPSASAPAERIVIDVPTPGLILEGLRRKMTGEILARKLGGGGTVLQRRTVGLCTLESVGLLPEELECVQRCDGHLPLREILPRGAEADLGAALYGLVVLGHLEVVSPDARASAALPRRDIDRVRIHERLSTARVSDYFSILGVTRSATAYELRQAYLELRRELAACSAGEPAIAEIAGSVLELTVIVEEAYEVLRDPALRASYDAHLP